MWIFENKFAPLRWDHFGGVREKTRVTHSLVSNVGRKLRALVSSSGPSPLAQKWQWDRDQYPAASSQLSATTEKQEIRNRWNPWSITGSHFSQEPPPVLSFILQIDTHMRTCMCTQGHHQTANLASLSFPTPCHLWSLLVRGQGDKSKYGQKGEDVVGDLDNS